MKDDDISAILRPVWSGVGEKPKVAVSGDRGICNDSSIDIEVDLLADPR